MLQKIQKHITQNFSFLKRKKILLATSGGLDSMVMVDLFRRMDFEIAMAHCNFQLRGLESLEDQKFVQEYAQTNKIDLFLTQFETENYAKNNQLSTQVAARELRYNWFQEILEIGKFDFIVTAHHADDTLETFIINLSRGTGIEGLTGIPAQNGTIIRPLLIFSKEEIENFAIENQIKWREDSSNNSDKYLRNKIRHHLVPVLKDLNPDFLSSFLKTQNYLQESKLLTDDASKMVYEQVAKQVEQVIHFDLNRLTERINYKTYLYHWLHEYGFTAWDDIYDLVDGQSGKQVFSNHFRLLKDRETLLLIPKKTEIAIEEFLIEKSQNIVNFPLNIVFCNVTDIGDGSNTIIFVDEDKLHFPLVLRKWESGDSFQPFGMNGKTKKVSKLFKDEKKSLVDKENTWILCSDNQIVWVVGTRQDERFKIENTTKNILKIELEK